MEENKNNINIFSINMSAELPIDIKPVIGRKWVLNGCDNEHFKWYMDAYDDSTTNSSIIDSYSNYTYAEGLQDKNGVITYDIDGNEILNTKKLNVEKHLNKKDARLITSDYKKYGSYAVQVIWNSAKNKEDKKPIQIKYFPVFKLGLNINEFYDVNGYWYSWDWTQKQKYVPKLYQKFDGIYKGEDVELYVVNRPSSDSFFSKPDWVSGLRYAQLEGRLATSSYYHVDNNFQAGKMINFNNGIPDDVKVMEEIKRDLDRKFKGANKQNQFFVTFNEGKETAPEIIDMGIAEINNQYVYFSEECERRLIVAHKASPVIFASTRDGSGLSNNSDEIEMATAMMYRKTINPMREVILDGLQFIFDYINPEIKLFFKDFSSFKGDKREEVAGIKQAFALEGRKIGFDFDVANTEKGKAMIKDKLNHGYQVYLISGKDSDIEMKTFAALYRIPRVNVYAMGDNQNKVKKVKELGLREFYDNNSLVIQMLPGIGKQFN